MASTDSIATVEAALRDSLDFDTTGSLAKANTCVVACREWLLLRPGTASNESSSLSLNIAQVENILRRAETYIATSDTTAANSRTAYCGFAGFRT